MSDDRFCLNLGRREEIWEHQETCCNLDHLKTKNNKHNLKNLSMIKKIRTINKSSDKKFVLYTAYFTYYKIDFIFITYELQTTAK